VRERSPGVWEVRVVVGFDPARARSIQRSFTVHGDAALAGQARRDLVAEYGSARIDSRRGVGGHGGGAACARRLFDAEQSLLLVRLAASASRGDLPLLRHVADGFLAKYGSDWAFAGTSTPDPSLPGATVSAGLVAASGSPGLDR